MVYRILLQQCCPAWLLSIRCSPWWILTQFKINKLDLMQLSFKRYLDILWILPVRIIFEIPQLCVNMSTVIYIMLIHTHKWLIWAAYITNLCTNIEFSSNPCLIGLISLAVRQGGNLIFHLIPLYWLTNGNHPRLLDSVMFYISFTSIFPPRSLRRRYLPSEVMFSIFLLITHLSPWVIKCSFWISWFWINTRWRG